VNVTGIVTARDRFVIDFDKSSLRNRIMIFRNLALGDEFIRQSFKLKDTRGWKLAIARKGLAHDENWDMYYQKMLYRPFDVRYIYYTPKMVDWPRPEVMPHLTYDNFALIVPKQFKEQPGAFVTNNIAGHKTVSAYDINYIFPLYLYSDVDKKDLFSHLREPSRRESNIGQNVSNALAEAYKKEPPPEEVFYYVYALLYSNTYRSKYLQFLKIDFPRVPFTRESKVFSKMVEFGNILVELHLMKSKELDSPIARFRGNGENTVDKVRYQESRVRVNNEQFFEGVEPEVWEYQIGGYQVCDKWLKDRKGKKLSLEEIKHYCKIVTALEKTISIQKEIDRLYPKVEESVIDFHDFVR
jgi:predicted helicase